MGNHFGDEFYENIFCDTYNLKPRSSEAVIAYSLHRIANSLDEIKQSTSDLETTLQSFSERFDGAF